MAQMGLTIYGRTADVKSHMRRGERFKMFFFLGKSVVNFKASLVVSGFHNQFIFLKKRLQRYAFFRNYGVKMSDCFIIYLIFIKINNNEKL